MKNISKILVASTALALATTAAFADTPSVTLTVTGTVQPQVCVPTLSKSIDFGTIAKTDLVDASNGFSSIGKDQFAALTVACAAPTSFAISSVDNKAGTVSDKLPSLGYDAFGFGQTPDGVNIGGYELKPRSIIADGKSIDAYRATDGTASVWTKTTAFDAQGNLTRFGDSATEYGSYTTVSTIIDVKPLISNALNFGQEIKLDGSSTLEVKYL